MNVVLLFLLVLSLVVVAVAGFLLTRDKSSFSTETCEHSRKERDVPSFSGWFPEILLSPQDLVYVRQQHSAEALTLFQDERRKLTLLWLKEVRSRTVMVRRRHAETARRDARLEPGMELKIALSYWSLYVTCTMARYIVHLFGPFRFQAFIRYVNLLSRKIGGAVGDVPLRDSSTTLVSNERQA